MLLSWAIQLACQNAYQNQQLACQKAMEAFSKQSQIYSLTEKTENYYTLEAKNTSSNYLGSTGTDILVGTAYTVRAVHNKSVSFKLPNLGLCDTVSNQITTNSYTLNLKWNFPWLK